MTRNIFTGLGAALLLVGSGLYITSPAISENDAVQRTARVTTGADGQKMYTVTGAEVHDALHRRQEANSGRANNRRIGGVLAVSGVALLLAGTAVRIASTGNTKTEHFGSADRRTSGSTP